MIYEIKTFKGGLSDYEDRGTEGAFKFGANLNIRKDKDSLSCGQALVDEGLRTSHSPSLSASPSSSVSRSPSRSFSASPSPTDSPSASPSPSSSGSSSPSRTPSASPSPTPEQDTVFQDLILFFIECSDGYTYGFGDQGHIYRRDADAFWQHMYKDPNGRITGAAEWSHINKKKYLYWATRTKLNRKEIPGNNNWNDINVGNWQKTNLTSSDWHTMREAGGSLIICNNEFLALVGYDESYTNEALDMIPGNIAKTLVERSGRSIVGTYRASKPLKGVNAAIDTEMPLAQIGNEGKLYFADMSNQVPLKQFPGGGIVNPGGVASEEESSFFEWEQGALSWIDKQTVKNMAYFAVYNATTEKNGIYTYGRRKLNQPITLNLEYEIDWDEGGALGNVNGTILASYRDGSEYGVKAVDPNNKATAIYEGLDFRFPPKKPADITVSKTVQCIMEPLPAGTKVEFWYRMNKSGDFVQAKTADGNTQFTTNNARKAVFRLGVEGEIYEPRAVLIPFGNLTPDINAIQLNFD